MNQATTGIIFDIKRFAIHDGPGIRTTVFFKGCPLACWWCHNPESRNPDIEQFPTIKQDVETTQTIGYKVSVEEVVAEIKRDVVFYDESGGGVTFSGGEPLFQPTFLVELLAACQSIGIHTCIDTSGYCEQDILENMIDHTDLFLFDLKLMNARDHEIHTGVPGANVIANLEFLLMRKANLQIRIPLIPGITDGRENLEDMAKYISHFNLNHDIALLPFNLFAQNKFHKFQLNNRLTAMKSQSAAELERLVDIFRGYNLNVTIGG